MHPETKYQKVSQVGVFLKDPSFMWCQLTYNGVMFSTNWATNYWHQHNFISKWKKKMEGGVGRAGEVRRTNSREKENGVVVVVESTREVTYLNRTVKQEAHGVPPRLCYTEEDMSWIEPSPNMTF